MRIVMVLAAVLGLAACSGTDPDAPSGACAQDEQSALSLYGPPLGVSTSGGTTTYTWANAVGTFTAEGSSCTESIT
jgi:ABC-type glycerol-3-phosphate transport system substrate-binding protein